MKRNLGLISCLSLATTLAVVGCEDPPKPTPAASSATAATTASAMPSASTATPDPDADAASPLSECLYFPQMAVPKDNPLTEAKITLGKMLFFDPRLGKDGKFSCESCHYEDRGWADGEQFSKKANGDANGRHTPALYNVGYLTAWYWEGRAETLEKQVIAAWKGQMGGDPDKVAADLAKIDGYKKAFKEAYAKDDISADDIVNALASYVRTVRSCNSPWDKSQNGDKAAVDESVKRGFELFRNKAGCAVCHVPPLYTDLKYHNVGIGMDKPEPDVGRSKISQDDKDKGAFKTTTLRSITLHPPYFHDGSAKTLEEAIDYMLTGGKGTDNLDSAFKKVELTPEERTDLIAFVKSLEGERPSFEKPELP